MFEPLRKNLSIREVSLRVYSPEQIRDGKPDAWHDLKGYLKKVRNDDTVSCINLDTVDKAHQSCINHHCAKEDIDYPNDINDFGTLWNRIAVDFEETLNSIRDMNKGLVLISHAKETEVEVVTGGVVKQYGPSCSKAPLTYIKQACDFAFFYGYDSQNRRCIHVRGYTNIWTACGVNGRFMSPSGNKLEKFEIPEDHPCGWEIVEAAFRNEVYDADEEIEQEEEETKPRLRKRKKSSTRTR